MITRADLAQNITQQILKNLEGRSGFKHLIESIRLEDEETYMEIINDIADVIENAIIHWEN